LLAYFAASLAFHEQDDNYQRDYTEDNPTGFLLSSFTNESEHVVAWSTPEETQVSGI